MNDWIDPTELRELDVTPRQAVCWMMLLVVLLSFCALCSQPEQPPYSKVDYAQDTAWCLDHNYEFRSNVLYGPVTCLKNGSDVAVPPHSLNLAKRSDS